MIQFLAAIFSVNIALGAVCTSCDAAAYYTKVKCVSSCDDITSLTMSCTNGDAFTTAGNALVPSCKASLSNFKTAVQASLDGQKSAAEATNLSCPAGAFDGNCEDANASGGGAGGDNEA